MAPAVYSGGSYREFMSAVDRMLAAGRPLATVLADDVESAWDAVDAWADPLDGTGRLLACRCDPVPPLPELIDRVVSSLAAAALADWPDWYGLSLPAALDRATVFERNAALRDGLRLVARRHLRVVPPWLRRAAEACLRGHEPFDPSASRELQAGQLALAVGAGRLSIALGVGPLAPTDGAPALVAAAEWLHRVTGGSVLLVLPTDWQCDPIVQRAGFHTDHLSADPVQSTPPSPGPAGVTVTVSPLPGRPAPNSPAEQALYRRVRVDPELAPLLEFNRTVHGSLGQPYRVDLLCRSRQVAIEVDGDDHRVTAGKYDADCGRDFDLMRRGYLVLRLPNTLVLGDPEMAVLRIRELLRYRAAHHEGGADGADA